MKLSTFVISSVRNIVFATFSLLFSRVTPFWLQRRILSRFGSQLGPNSCIHGGVKIFSGPRNLHIGRNSTINAQSILDNRGSIRIGDNVSISQGVKIYTGGHNIHSRSFEYQCKSVEIQDFAVIFSHAIISPGVYVGKGAVILPGSVVAKSVPDFEIWGGNPAKKVSERRRDLSYKINHQAWWSL